MRTSEAARYARWAATVAILLAASAGGVYAYRWWQAAQARRQAPPAVPPTVQQRSAEFSFSKVEQDRTLFTVRASRATEFKEGSKSLLEDVWITIYGRAGGRFDNIHTRACDYEPKTGRIVCAGEVQIDLESAEEARQRPGQRVLHLGTSNVSFNRETGEARTDQPVVFRFPYGHGRGVGVTYSTREAIVRLHREVELTLARGGRAGERPGPESAEPVVLTGAGLEYQRNARTLRLLPPVRVRQGNRELVAGSLALEFDASLRARRLVLGEQPQLRSSESRGQLVLAAEEFVAWFHAEGWTERVEARGNVTGNWKDAAADNRLEAQRLEMELEPRRNEPRLLTASGDVRLTSQVAGSRGGAFRRLETASLRLLFEGVAGRRQRRLARGETLAPATVELASGEETTRVQAERLAAEFGAQNRLRQLTGHSGVEVERRLGRRPAQSTRSREVSLTFGPGSEWSEVELHGSVRFRDGDRTAQAERARMVRAQDTVTLSGSAQLSDALARTTAGTLTFNQRTGEVRGEGGVRTSYLAAERNAITNLAPAPAHISAEELLAQRDTGRALYSGRARLWQGDAMIEAASIELLREGRRLEARGGVLGLFPQAQEAPAASAPSAGGAGRTPWRFRASSLTYWSAEGRARLEENVTAQSRLGQIQAPVMELFLSSAADGLRNPGGLTRALASGGVTVRQGERRGTAERAEYSAAEGKFVLAGGNPALHDAGRGTTTGRQLTFFLADDKILVDSEEGTRTLTKHRVEK